MQVSISPDFQNLLPPLNEAELKQHEQNCQGDPNHERMPPVLVWENGGNLIIDGHNQYRVRQKHRLKIRYSTLTFASREEAMLYALRVQFGRRNLDASQRAIAYAKVPRVPEGRPGENVAKLQRLSDLADSAGVSKRTMSDAVKVVDKGVPEIVASVQAGDYSASDAAAIVDMPEQEQKRIAEEAKQTGTTLKAAKISGGTSFNTDELDGAITIAVRPPKLKNGTSVISGKEKALALKDMSAFSRKLRRLSVRLFDKYSDVMSELIREIKEL